MGSSFCIRTNFVVNLCSFRARVRRFRHPSVFLKFVWSQRFVEDWLYINLDTLFFVFSSNLMSKKRGCGVGAPTAKRIHSEPGRLWRIVTEYPDIFDNFILPKLSGNDVKFLYDVNTESRMAIKRSGEHLCVAFKICDFTKSTLSWALEKCSEEKERFCDETARKGNLELLQYLHEKGCPWDVGACYSAAGEGQLECLKYLHENGCPWGQLTCISAARGGHLECLKYLHEKGCPWHELACLLGLGLLAS